MAQKARFFLPEPAACSPEEDSLDGLGNPYQFISCLLVCVTTPVFLWKTINQDKGSEKGLSPFVVTVVNSFTFKISLKLFNSILQVMPA